MNAGGWFCRGVTLMGSTRVAFRPAGSFADVPSVTSKEIDAGPKYLLAEVKRRVRSFTTRLPWMKRLMFVWSFGADIRTP